LIGVLRNKFNLIIVDFAPLGPVVDARAASPALDTFILVAEWGRTKSDILSRTAKMLGRDTHILGAILNKVDFSAMRRFDSAAADYYASPTYKSYRK
jgi:succinoglycan biosynthesis transport protein ExoP